MNVIACSLITGGADSLESIDHLDIFGDNRGIPVVPGDLCFVIMTSNISYIYKAVAKSTPTTSGTLTIAMISGGSIQWNRMVRADTTAVIDVPSGTIVDTVDGTVPSGYDVTYKFAPYQVFDDFCTGGDASITTSMSSCKMGMNSDSIYWIKNTGQDFWRLGLDGVFEVLDNTPVASNYTKCLCACLSDDDIYMFQDNNAYKFDTGTKSWSTMTANIPISLSANGNSACAAVGDKIYIFDWTGAVYEYDTVGDSYVLKTSPVDVYDGNGAAIVIGTKIHLLFRKVPSIITVHIYDTVANTWDETTVPDGSLYGCADMYTSVIYDSFRGYVAFLGTSSHSDAVRAFGYDTSTYVWSTYWASSSLANYDNGLAAMYDPASDKVFACVNTTDVMHIINPKEKRRCLKQ